MSKLTRIGVLSLAKQLAGMFAVFGLFLGILYSVGGFFYDYYFGYLSSGTALAFLALIGMPLMLALYGFVLGLIVAPIYNFVAKRTGGIEIQFEEG